MFLTSKVGRLCALTVLVAGVFVAPAVVAAQGPDEPGAIDWRDQAGALEERDRITGRIAEIEAELDEAEAELAELGAQLSTMSLDESMATERLLQAQERARALAVEAYVTGSAAELDSFLLGTGSAAELTYMSFLLEEHAEAILEAGRAYKDLREQASTSVIQLSDQIDAVRAKRDDLAAESDKLAAALPAAEHHVFISGIHAQAEESLARTGRPDPTPAQWEALRFCESTLDYRTATGNGFYGAYQFTIDTWYTVGGRSSPDVASPEEQDARARLLYARRGSQPWPICGRYLP